MGIIRKIGYGIGILITILFSWMGGPRGYFVHVTVNIVLAIFAILGARGLYYEYKKLEG